MDDKVYKILFAFNSTIDSLKLTVDRPKLGEADKERLKAAMTAQS